MVHGLWSMVHGLWSMITATLPVAALPAAAEDVETSPPGDEALAARVQSLEALVAQARRAAGLETTVAKLAAELEEARSAWHASWSPDRHHDRARRRHADLVSRRDKAAAHRRETLSALSKAQEEADAAKKALDDLDRLVEERQIELERATAALSSGVRDPGAASQDSGARTARPVAQYPADDDVSMEDDLLEGVQLTPEQRSQIEENKAKRRRHAIPQREAAQSAVRVVDAAGGSCGALVGHRPPGTAEAAAALAMDAEEAREIPAHAERYSPY